MNKLIKKMSKSTDLHHLIKATEEQVTLAEKKLGTSFADEYREYVMYYGAASFMGHELTGVCNSKRLNVVDVTNEERANNPNIPNDMYVIEQAGIDSIVIWQDKIGRVYQTAYDSAPVVVANSIYEMIENEQ